MTEPEQLEIFGPAPGIVGRRHPDTSREAALEIEPRTGTDRRRVLVYVRAQPDGATDLEIQRALQLGGNTERPRRIELVAAGLLVDSGLRRTNPNGRRAIVWIPA